MAYLDAIGQKLPPPQQARTGVKWVSLSREFGALRGYRREGRLRVGHWLKSLFGEKMWAVFAWDDPIPAINSALRFSGRAVRYVAGDLRSRMLRLASSHSG